MSNMETALETKLREAEGRARVAENLITAAAVLDDAGVPPRSPQAHRLFHEIVRLPDASAMRQHVALDAIPLREAVSPPARKTYTAAARKLLAKEGKARPDGSYPIRDARDVEAAVDDFNRSNGSPDDKAHIIKRAKPVPGGTDALPADWSGSTHLQESAKRLEQQGIPTLDGGPLGPVRLREATAADLAQWGIPSLDDAAQEPRQALAELGIPMLPESPGHHIRFAESVGGEVLRRIS